jgi:acetyl esterase/lipase
MARQLARGWIIIGNMMIAVSLFVLAGCSQSNTDSVSDSRTDQRGVEASRQTIDAQLRRHVSTVPANVDVSRNIEYAVVGDVALFLDLYLPQIRDGTAPLLVWIHGGGWRQGSKDWCPLTWMTGHGYAVASIEYRLSGQATFPAQIHDCKGAIRWLRAHAEVYNLNRQKIGVAGLSAGGQLAALIGTSGDKQLLEGTVGGNLDQSSRVQAVFDMSGPSDFLLVIEDFPEYAAKPDTNTARLFGGPPAEKRKLAELASSVSHVTQDDPPLLIFHGEEDPLVPPKQSRRLRDVYQNANLAVTLAVIPGGKHVPKEYWDDARQRKALAFFDEHLKTDN